MSKLDNIQSALDFSRAFGIPILPAGGHNHPNKELQKNPKHLGDDAHKLATTDEGQIRRWEATMASWDPEIVGWGAYPSGRFVVFDCDRKPGKPDGLISLRDYIIAAGGDPDALLENTLKVVTPTNGVHYYFQEIIRSNGTQSTSKTGVLPGLDIRAGVDGNGFVMIPPTFSEALQTGYFIARAAEIAPMPPVLATLIPEKKGAKDTLPVLPETITRIKNASDQAEEIRLAEAFSADSIGDFTKGNRNHAVFKLANDLHERFFIEAEDAVQIIRGHAPWRDNEPLSEEEIRKAVTSAWKDPQKAGVKNPAAIYAEFPIDEEFLSVLATVDAPRPAPKLMEDDGEDYIADLVDARDLLLRDITPPRKWLIEGFLSSGEIGSLYGEGGTGKSLLSQQIAMCVCRPWMDFFGHPISHCNVVSVVAEDSLDEYDRRGKEIAKGLGIDPHEASPFRHVVLPRRFEDNIMQDRDGSLSTFGRKLINTIKRLPGEKLVILDTLTDFYGGSENDRREVNTFVKSILGQLVREAEATVLVIAHPSQSGVASGRMMSGSTAWNNSVRARLSLRRHKEPALAAYRILSVEKSNYGDKDLSMNLHWVQTDSLQKTPGFFTVATTERVVEREQEALDQYLIGIINTAAETGSPVPPTSATSHYPYIKEALEGLLRPGAVKRFIYGGASRPGASKTPTSREVRTVLQRLRDAGEISTLPYVALKLPGGEKKVYKSGIYSEKWLEAQEDMLGMKIPRRPANGRGRPSQKKAEGD